MTGFFLLGLLPHLVAFSWLPYTQLCNSYSIIKQVNISAVGCILWAIVRCLTFHLRCKNQHLQHLCKYWLLPQWGLSCEATCSLREWHQEVQTISFKKTPVAFFFSPLFFLWHHPALATWRVPHYMKPWNFLHLLVKQPGNHFCCKLPEHGSKGNLRGRVVNSWKKKRRLTHRKKEVWSARSPLSLRVCLSVCVCVCLCVCVRVCVCSGEVHVQTKTLTRGMNEGQCLWNYLATGTSAPSRQRQLA